MTTKADHQKIYEDLVAVGFSDHEARIYLALALAPQPATAYEIAKAAQIPVANTYNVMRSLAKKGATSQVSKNPVRHIAKSPAEVFNSMATEMQKRCQSLVSRFDNIRPELSDQYVEILNGRGDVERRIAAIIDGAEQQIALKSYTNLSPSLMEALERAIKRGVRLLFVYNGERPRLPKGNVHLWPHEGNAADWGAYFSTISVDSSAALAFDGESFVAAFSENRTFVYLVDVYFRHEIYLAEIMLKLEPEIEALFGPALHRIRSEFGMVPINEQMRAFINARLPPAQALGPKKSSARKSAAG